MAGNRIKGLTIEIGGNTTKLTDSLKDVDKSLKDTQTQLKDVNKLLKLDPKNVDLLKQRHELLGKAVSDTKKRQEELKKALEQLKDAGSTEENRKQQDLLQRELLETTNKLEDLTKEYGNAFTPQLQAVSAASAEVADKTKGISTAAGIAAGGMLAMAANAAASADDLLTLSNNTGFSVEELQKLQYASSFVDVSMDTMTGSISKLTKNMQSGNDAFEKLGISVTRSDGTMRDATDVWYETIEALGHIGNETERDQISMELFGKSAMDMAGIVDDGGASLKALGEEAEATGNILSQDAVEDAVKFNDQIDELKGKASQAFFEAGAALADTLLPALETLVDVVTDVLSWFGNLDGSTQAFILTVLGLVAAISPIAGIISTITGVAAALNVAMLPMIGTIAAIVAGVAAAVAIGVALYKNWDTIKQKAGELASNLKQKFDDIKNSISDKIEAAKEKVRNAIEAIKGFFKFKFEWPKMTLPHFSVSGSLNPINWLKDGLPKISVDWYAKAMETPMLLDGATIFGSRGNTLLGGGEAGKEVILGLDKLREYAGGNVTNFNIAITQQPGQDAEELARVVSRQIQKDIMNKKAVWQ
jgi:phage-related minor tail protein